LEDLRDIAVSRIISMLQSQVRMYAMKKRYKLMVEEIIAKSILQRNIKKYLSLRNWPWWKLYTKVNFLLIYSLNMRHSQFILIRLAILKLLLKNFEIYYSSYIFVLNHLP